MSDAFQEYEKLELEDENLNGYKNFILNVIKKYKKYVKMTSNDMQITPADINTALAYYPSTYLSLIGEYNIKKLKHFEIKRKFQAWYDSKFVEIKTKMIEEAEKKQGDKKSSIKLAVKEYETELRNSYKEEYNNWTTKVTLAEYEERMILRILDLFKGFDTILSTMGSNSRQEMRTLSLQNRMNTINNPTNPITRTPV